MSDKTNTKKTDDTAQIKTVKCRVLKKLELGEAVIAPNAEINISADKAKTLEEVGKVEILGL